MSITLILLRRFWPYIAGLAIIAAILGFTYSKGRAAGAASVQAKYAKAADKALAAMKRGQAKIDDLDRAYAATSATQQSNARTIHYETQRIIDRPVYRNACVDGAGLGLLDRAADNANRSLARFTPANAR
tara:strand:- start:12825 stop:13214 length:390 start_codon:yes stop_codon:yes gene_type:complete